MGSGTGASGFRLHGAEGAYPQAPSNWIAGALSVHVLPSKEPDLPTDSIWNWLLARRYLLLIAIAVWVALVSKRAARDWRLDGKTLVVLDSATARSWRHTFDDAVRTPPNPKPPVANAVWFGDLDGDGKSKRYSSTNGQVSTQE